MKKLLAIVSVMLLLTVACKDEAVEEAAPVEAAPVEEVAPAVEEVAPAVEEVVPAETTE